MDKEYMILFLILILSMLYVCSTLTDSNKQEGFNTTIPSDQINSDHIANTIPLTTLHPPNPAFVGSDVGDSYLLRQYIQQSVPRTKPVILRANYHPSASKEDGLLLNNKIIYDPPLKSFNY